VKVYEQLVSEFNFPLFYHIYDLLNSSNEECELNACSMIWSQLGGSKQYIGTPWRPELAKLRGAKSN
jgi:hypothetical protein